MSRQRRGVRGSRLAAGAAGLMAILVVASCGGSSLVATRQHEFAYQIAIGKINQRFAAKPPQTAAASEAMLARAIRQYRALTPPPPLKRAHLAVVAGLQRELRAVRSGIAEGADAAAAVRRYAAARASVARALKRIAALVSSCRAVQTNC